MPYPAPGKGCSGTRGGCVPAWVRVYLDTRAGTRFWTQFHTVWINNLWIVRRNTLFIFKILDTNVFIKMDVLISFMDVIYISKRSARYTLSTHFFNPLSILLLTLVLYWLLEINFRAIINELFFACYLKFKSSTSTQIALFLHQIVLSKYVSKNL